MIGRLAVAAIALGVAAPMFAGALPSLPSLPSFFGSQPVQVVQSAAAASPLGSLMDSSTMANIEDIAKLRSDNGWQPFSRGWNLKTLEGKKDAIIKVLGQNGATAIRNRVTELRGLIRSREADIASMSGRLMVAPATPEGTVGQIKSLLGQGDTREDLEGRIAAARQDVARARNDIAKLSASFNDELRKIGIDLPEDQLSSMMDVATSGDLAEVLAVFRQVKEFDERLRKDTERSGESMAVARRYYAMHAIMIDVLRGAQDQFIYRIEHEYLAKLDDLMQQTLMTRETAMAQLRASVDPAKQKVSRSNIDALDLTLRVGRLYQRILRDQLASMKQIRVQTEEEYQLAATTAKTVEIGADMMGMVKNSDEMYSALRAVTIPDLRPFEAREMRKELEAINIRLGT